MKYLSRKRILIGTAVVLIAAGVIHYTGGSSLAKVEQAQPAVPVTVETVKSQKVRVWTEFSGRLHAVDSAEIKPEVGGRITQIRFDEGSIVKAGDILLVIDPRPYEAAVAKAEADVATANTNANFAQLEMQRAETMVKTQAIAQRLYDERANSSRVAGASIKSAEAELKKAKLDLEHAYVRAPISGRVGRAELTVGNLVQTVPNSPLLTTIVANDTIYADFDVDEQTYMQNVRNVANNRGEERQIPVELTVQGDKGHSYKGTIYSFDNRIDPATGTIRARAKFNNSDGALIPGMFVAVSLASATDNEVILVPQQALGFDQNKKFVYVVGADNKVVYREVELGKEVKGDRIVSSGLKPGERVIIDGVQHVRPDVIVDAKDVAATQSDALMPAAKETPTKK